AAAAPAAVRFRGAAGRLAVFIAFAFLTAAPGAFGQTVVVRVLNQHGLRPIPGLAVTVQELSPGAASAAQRGRTNKSGEVAFHLPALAAASIWVMVAASKAPFECRCAALLPAAAVERKGIVVLWERKAKKAANEDAGPKPGEITFVAKPLGLLQRLLGALERG
ncbi:MAG: hypothetical protein ACRD17_15040, partial [Terriglobales bacterium]